MEPAKNNQNNKATPEKNIDLSSWVEDDCDPNWELQSDRLAQEHPDIYRSGETIRMGLQYPRVRNTDDLQQLFADLDRIAETHRRQQFPEQYVEQEVPVGLRNVTGDVCFV